MVYQNEWYTILGWIQVCLVDFFLAQSTEIKPKIPSLMWAWIVESDFVLTLGI